MLKTLFSFFKSFRFVSFVKDSIFSIVFLLLFLKSTEVLTKEGFKVMVYCTDDPLMAKKLDNLIIAKKKFYKKKVK